MTRTPPEGLCTRCEHRRQIAGARGGRYVLCALSRRDEGFPRYPRLPVRSCAGFSSRQPRAGASTGGREADAGD